MTKAALATKGLGETAEKSATRANKGFDLASRGSLLLGGAVAGALVGIVTKAADFEKAMSGVAAATQAPTSELGKLREAAIKAGADTQYSATEAADAITELAKAGVSTSDILKGGLTGALDLAAAGQLDVADAAQIAATAMTQFSLSGDQLPHVADLLAAGAGKAQGSVDDLGQALNQAGLVASQTGASIEETTGVLSAFASAGLIGSDAGTSLKTALQRLQAPSQQAADLMQQLGINAYDAQGNFVGFSALAGQLHDGLGDLTQAQRDSALATIFGSDAVRAANVLYSNGAAGIDEWTKKVNDAGYASKQAHDLTDNLSGDLERLGGSFDTLLISLGQGAQGPLREMVQVLGGLVDGLGAAVKWFSDLPGPVQAAVAAFALWAVAGGKIVGLAQTVGKQLGFIRDVMGSLGGPTNVAKDAISGLAKAIGPELGAAAATLAVSALVSDFATLTHAGGDAKQQIDDFNESLSHIDGNSARLDAISQGIADFTKQLRDAQAAASAPAEASSGAWLVGLSGALADVAVHAKDAGADVDYYQQQIDRLEAKQKTAATATDELSSRLGISRDEVIQLADKYGVDLTGSLDTVYGRFLLARASAEGMSGAMDNASSTSGAFQAQLDQVAQSAQDAKDQTDAFKLSLDILTGKQVNLNQVEAAYYAALDDATGALKGLNGRVVDNAGNLDLSTEAGRKTNEILTNLASTSNQYISTLIQQGATSEEANAKDAELRKSFYQTALQMTGSKEAAERLTDSIFGIPEQRTTQINADVAQAQRNIQTTQTQIDNLHGKTVTVSVRADGTVAAILGGDNISPFITHGYAEGGYTGPGGKYQPAGVVHAGEVVWSQADVAAHGGPANVDAMRRYRPLRGYADGGIVIDVDGRPVESTIQDLMTKAKALTAFAPVGSGVARWSGLVGAVLAMLHQPTSLIGAVLQLIAHESGGNPYAINNWDINAQRGDPSRGLMQTIGSTFNAYAGPYRGLGIYNPLANIYAGLNYGIHRYGAVSSIPGIYSLARGGSYRPYDDGGLAVGAGLLAKGPQPERVLNPRQTAAFEKWMAGRDVAGSGRSAQPAQFIGDLYLDSGEFLGKVRGVASAAAEGVMTEALSSQRKRASYTRGRS